MDVDFLSGMIGELILDRDTLSLPGLGTFVAEDMPASFSDRGYTINPPYRRLSFTERATDDGVLAAFYARDNSIEPEEAKAILDGYLKELADEVRERGSVDLPGLGRLRSTRNGHFFFVPDESLDISPDTCGLGPVSLKAHDRPSLAGVAVPQPAVTKQPEPVAEEAPAAPEAVPETPAKALARKRRPGLRIAIGAFAAAVVMLVAFVALSRIAPDFTDRLLYTQEELEILNYPEDGLGLPG